MKPLEEMDTLELIEERRRLETRLARDKRDYPLNWRFIGAADKERLVAVKARLGRKSC